MHPDAYDNGGSVRIENMSLSRTRRLLPRFRSGHPGQFGRGLMAFCLAGACFTSPAGFAQSDIQNRLRARVESGLATESFAVMDERVHARETLRRFYPARNFTPVWLDGEALAPHAEAFMDWLVSGPARQGLRSEHYHLDAIESLELDRNGALVDMELALSDAFLIVGSHFLVGRLNPETLDSEWLANRRHRDLAPLLGEAATGATRVAGADERVVDPATVDWSGITARNFPYRLRQGPGPLNALGQVKFMFPNKFSVYLHDTPSRELFNEDARAFSSGCIRLAQPLDLAALLLADDTRWPRAAIDAAIAGGREQSVTLNRPIAVHLLYWTAWVDENGTLQFRDDIYGRDQPVMQELREDPPT
jgi:murein L,D-transpeptidase YcbB/YkuD